MRVLRLRVLTTISALLLMVPVLAHGQTLTAVWDPNPPADAITNYEICIGTTSASCNFQLASVPANETSYTFSPTAGVLYHLAVRAANAAGPGPFSSEVVISIPGLTQPANQTSTANVAISPLSLSATDPDGGLLQFTHSGLPFGLSLNQSSGIISGTPTSAGSFNVTVFVSDGTVTTSRTFTWTVNAGSSGPDTSAPSLAITSHTAGQTVNLANVTLAGTATDNGAGGSGITSVTVNGAAATGGTAAGSTSASWSRSVALVAGPNTFTVVATDGAGNARTASITINRPTPDTTAPSLSITSHSSGQTLSAATITLAGSASDNGTGGSGITSVTVNGSAAAGGSTSGNNTANWSRSITLSAGTNVVTVVATDGAGNARTTPITLIAPTPSVPTTGTTVVPNPASPQLTGTSVTLTAGASGGTAPYSYKWWVQKDGGAWTLLRDWNTNTTLIWTPNASGSYAIGLWTRSAGFTTDVPQITAQLAYTVTAPPQAQAPPPPQTPPPPSITPMTTSLVTDRTSPQVAGTTVTITTNAAGGVAPYAYKLWLQRDGGTWTMLRDWSANTTFAWTPTASGSYMLGVWTRSAGQTADLPQITAQTPFTVTGSSSAPQPPPAPQPPAAGPMTATSIVPDRSSPQSVGTGVTFTASGTGGTAPYAYKWWAQRDGGAWVMLQDWSTTTAFTWTPSMAGNYRIGLWARSAGVTTDLPQTTWQVSYVVTSGSAPAPQPPAPQPPSAGPMTGTSMVPSVASPQAGGTTVTFTASGSGGSAPYAYKWWVQRDGGTWFMMQDWSTSTTFTWTTSVAGRYTIGLWARSAGVTTDLPQITSQATYVISTTVPSVPMTGATVTSSQASPRVGTSVTLSASASGGTTPYSYRWWVQRNGGAWVMLQDWNTSATLNWTPMETGSYIIGLWARGTGSATDLPETTAVKTLLVTP
jgi:hypothetical protein